MEVYLNQKRIKLNPKNAIGKGGEADVYDLKNGQVLKLFKTADHPDYQMLPQEQQAAKARLALHQQKMRVFPQNLPARVIKPETLAMDKQGTNILGYAMPFLQNTVPLLKYSDRTYRQTNAISTQVVTNLFRDLHETVLKIHQANVTIGDFNDLNLLVLQNQVHLIDADSFQFGQFPCQVFTARFVDPMLCDRHANQPILTSPHNPDSDWYAFTVMLMQSLLYVDPYGGVYKPKSQAQIPHSARPLQRITIFHPDVRYPKPAIPYQVLSDDLLHHFHNCFEKDWRGDFPQSLLASMRWTKCNQCGIEHLKTTCPICIPLIVVLPNLSGNVTEGESKPCKVIQIFQTEGVILKVALHNNSFHYLYHENHEFKREDNAVLLSGELANIQFAIFGKSTIVAKQGKALTLNHEQTQAIATNLIHANSFSRYWIDQGQLLRDGKIGNEYIGDILEGQTQFWVGEKFGFGFYRAGSLSVAFTFDAKRSGICDRVNIPPIQGELIDVNCIFSSDLCWFFTITQEQGKIIHRVSVLRPNGELVATLAAPKDDLAWLTNIHSGSAIANWLFVPTDEGIARVEVNNGQIMITKIFPETEPYVDSGCSLIVASQGGIYVIHSQKILQLQLT